MVIEMVISILIRMVIGMVIAILIKMGIAILMYMVAILIHAVLIAMEIIRTTTSIKLSRGVLRVRLMSLYYIKEALLIKIPVISSRTVTGTKMICLSSVETSFEVDRKSTQEVMFFIKRMLKPRLGVPFCFHRITSRSILQMIL